MKRLFGRRDPEDILLQLDMLTREEIVAMVAVNVGGMPFSVRLRARINPLHVVC